MHIDSHTISPNPSRLSVRREHPVITSGFPVLDAGLAQGGWSATGLTEVVTRRNLALGLQLMLPVLAELTRQDKQRWVALVAPPFIPSLPGLVAAGVDVSRLLIVQPGVSNGIDVIEGVLTAGTCSAVLAWPMVDDSQIWDRLERAAELGDSLALMFRELGEGACVAHSARRIELQPEEDALQLTLDKTLAVRNERQLRIPYTQLYQLNTRQQLNSCH